MLISNSLSREMLNFSTFTESQNKLSWKGLTRNIHSITGQPKYITCIYNILPLFWKTNNVHIDPINRIMYEDHSHISSLLLRSTVNVCPDIFITGSLSLLLGQIPYIFLWALKEEYTTRHEWRAYSFCCSISKCHQFCGQVFLNQKWSVFCDIKETVIFQLKILWLTSIYIYLYISINISDSGCLDTQT